MDQTAERVLEILDLQPIEKNLYRGDNEARDPKHLGGRLFGGQVLAQSLRAAYHTVEENRHPHSIHAYFLRAGSAERPVLYEVDRIRDGKSFTTRRVVAIQEGRAIFNMEASFQIAETGMNHADLMPNVPKYDELEDDVAVVARQLANGEKNPRLSPMAGRERPFECRSVFPLGSDAWANSRRWNPVWMRFRQPIAEDDVVLANCLLAYASDMGLVSTAALPHAVDVPRADIVMASLDHGLWIHRPVPVNEWLLFHKRTTVAHGARGLNHAEFFSEDGTLLASVSQEGLLRQSGKR